MLQIILSLLLLAQKPDFTQKVIEALPSWEEDTLAQYEQPELAAVRLDLENGASDEQLHADWDALEVLDKQLKRNYVI